MVNEELDLITGPEQFDTRNYTPKPKPTAQFVPGRVSQHETEQRTKRLLEGLEQAAAAGK